MLAREQYFPATIADMYDPDRIDSEFPLVRQAHDHNDDGLERIYIGCCFTCNFLGGDTVRTAFPEELRLEKLFELYTKMTSQQASSKNPAKRKTKGG
ncbi:hypothetical protein [Synechococcus sp. PCC 6312]|uniref:hypothetical protein n=1 Tax=Synechococcus sp. (strain ATCC 27167 / PCC 6312) TaxID=195253 RepID=UPI0002E93377|nr:hypothetical protein [Synechococcus sp. PCC 6312]